jgi:hypothetical protein
VGGANRGPQVELYLGAVGLGPGEPWCCAFLIWCYREATLRASQLAMPLPKTGKCARLWARSDALWRSEQPSVGAIYIHLTDPADPNSSGHCGIVTGFTDRTILAVEGNTNAAGSRLGDRVRINTRRRDYVNVGYIDIGRGAPVDSDPVA